jgi:hypothetical protein
VYSIPQCLWLVGQRHWWSHQHCSLRHSMCLSVGFHAGSFKLADFGLARIFGSPDRNLTPRVSHKMPAI